MKFSKIVKTLESVSETTVPFWLVMKDESFGQYRYHNGEVYNEDKKVAVYDLIHEIKFIFPCW